MLASAGVDRQYEHQPSWTPRPVGHRGDCDRELHADADRRVYACQAALGRVTGAQLSVASVISANKGSRPYYDEDADAPRFGETLVQRLRRLYRALQLEARHFLASIAEGGARDGGESDGANSPRARAAQSLGSAGRQPRLLTRVSLTFSNGRRCFAFAGPRSFQCCSSRIEFELHCSPRWKITIACR